MMSDIRKWIKIVESVPATLLNQPKRTITIKQGATVALSPGIGGGVGRYMHNTPDGAMIDIKGIAKDIAHDAFSLPNQDYEDPYQNGNAHFHATVHDPTLGTMNNSPEFTSGDIVKIADVYGTAIGPGLGVFIAYSTSGQECIISFDNKKMLVPTVNISSVQEQIAKNNFDQTDNDGNLSPMSFGSNNVKIEKEPAMDQRDEFSKWMAAVEGVLSGESPILDTCSNECDCGNWDCPSCFPDTAQAAVVIGNSDVCPVCGHNDDAEHDALDCQVDSDINDIKYDEFNLEEEDNDFEQENFAKHTDVTLGDIFSRKNTKKDSGIDSPMNYDDKNLSDDDIDGMQVHQPLFGEEDESGKELISVISYMQDMGLSNADRNYSTEDLSRMTPDQLQQIHSKVTGNVSEASEPKPLLHDYLDGLDDVLMPKYADLPATFSAGDRGNAINGIDAKNLPVASKQGTQNKLKGMKPSNAMRDLMNRINPDAGSGEGELEQTPDEMSNQMTIRSASDVPSVISNSMKAAGMQTPEWHHINNLPGFRDRNVRGMGRQVFSMFTSTPIEQIQTMANVEGQGPNTDAEMRAVGAWLRDNAEDLGNIDVNHGMAIPGYKPDVKEYRLNGIRFHVVRDPMGQYIYAYPETEAKLNKLTNNNMKKIQETFKCNPSLFEQLKWDEEINAVLRENTVDDEIDEASTLSGKIGKIPGGARNQGGQNLVKWLHSKHKLSNDADLKQLPFSRNVLWTEFKSHPDNFVIVQGTDGVAGIKPSQAYIDFMTKKYADKGRTYNPAGDSNLKYQVVAFRNDGTKLDSALFQAPGKESTPKNDDDTFITKDPTVIRTRMGLASGKDTQNPTNVFNLLSEEIGTLQYVWVAGFWGIRGKGAEPQEIEPSTGAIERDKMKNRADMRTVAKPSEPMLVDKVFKKVRPVLKTLANQALGHINSRAKRYIEGGNFEGAAKVAQSGNKLKQFLATIDTSADVNLTSNPGFANQIKTAIAAASGARVGSDEYLDFLKAAAEGNSVALKPVLDALRDSLVQLS
jgi:hypothetical protein